MGYELRITRREFHADDRGPHISGEGWIALVEADAELERVVENGPYLARFLGDCRYGRGMEWFDWINGCITTKNPDEAILAFCCCSPRPGESGSRIADGNYRGGTYQGQQLRQLAKMVCFENVHY